MKTIAFVFLLVGAFVSTVSAQRSNSFQGVYKHVFPRLTHVPPLNTGMPLNILLGYINIDSFARTVSENSMMNFLTHLGYGDTSRQELSYLYAMDDYNPVAYYQFGITSPYPTYYRTMPVSLMHNFGRHLSAQYPDSGHAACLYYADYILDINILDTVSKNDTLSAVSKTVIGVSGLVLDTIKGRVLPLDDILYSRANAKSHQTLSTIPCVRYDYRPDRIRVSRTGNFFAKDSITVFPGGSSWIKPAHEYIVFLTYNDLHVGDSVNNYASLEPEYAFSTCASMYPVIDGIVYDPHDDFGFGVGLTREQFKNSLRARIATILAH